jgi:hypothetical protein
MSPVAAQPASGTEHRLPFLQVPLWTGVPLRPLEVDVAGRTDFQEWRPRVTDPVAHMEC